MWVNKDWEDYELIDTSAGRRLERWGEHILVRPDPQVLWKGTERDPRWKRADAVYTRSKAGGGNWNDNKIPESWQIKCGSLAFNLKLMGFKHVGLFPEQKINWDWFSELIRKRIAEGGKQPKVLNLFAYTGGSTVAAAAAGAAVCHVDASKGITAMAKDNIRINGLADAPVRYIVDDCVKFVEREIRRGNLYDAIILDPPSYGRGPGGEVWKLEDSIDQLVTLTSQVLSDDPLFYLLNSYSAGISANTMKYIVELRICSAKGGRASADEIGLEVTNGKHVLPCGSSARVVF